MRQSPLSQSQLGIYLGSAYRNDLTYHIAFLFRFDADMNPDKLAEAATKVLTSHPALTVAISTDENGEAQMVYDEHNHSEITIQSMTDAEFEKLKSGLIEHIDVPGDRLCRIGIIRTESAVWLTLLIHHIVFDGTSLRIFLRDLDVALKGGDLEPETASCFDIVEKEIAERASALYEKQREYYSRTFGDFDPDGSTLYSDAKGEQAFSHKVFHLQTPLTVFKEGRQSPMRQWV